MRNLLVIGFAILTLGTSWAGDATNQVGSNTAHVNHEPEPRSLAELLSLTPEQLEKVDVARIDLLCAEGLTGSEDLDVDYCIRTLDQWAGYVQNETKRNQHLFDEHPEHFKNSLAQYRMAMLATVLSQDLRIRYNPEREKQLENGHKFRSDLDENDFFGDSRDVFIHGLIGVGHYGTCASMPFLYVAIARRLGYPVTLATTATHFYVRYEEGGGKHLNVEATEHRAFLTPSDAEYRNPWELHLSDEEVDGMRYLQPLSNREILGHALLTRSAVLRSTKHYDMQAETWATAAQYLPDTPIWKEIIHDMQAIARNDSERDRRNAMWNEVAQLHVPHGVGYAYFQEKKVRLHLLMNYSTDTVAIRKAVKDFEDELREYAKPFIEPGDRGTNQSFGEADDLVLRYATAPGKVVVLPADFLPPFANRVVPPELTQRVAEKKLLDRDSILAEFWSFYDEAVQKEHKAMQRVVQQHVIQNGEGTILIARERVPQEYWSSIPSALQMRLAGLRDEQRIVDEMWAFEREEQVLQQQEQERARMLAREQAANLMRRRGITPPANDVGRVAPAPYSAQPKAGIQNEIPEMYQEWITPEAASRLTPGDIWLLQQNERNLQTAQRGAEWRQQMGPSQSQQIQIQFVPSALNEQKTQKMVQPNLPLTASPQSAIKPPLSEKGKE